jgi:hypothetical protein
LKRSSIASAICSGVPAMLQWPVSCGDDQLDLGAATLEVDGLHALGDLAAGILFSRAVGRVHRAEDPRQANRH